MIIHPKLHTQTHTPPLYRHACCAVHTQSALHPRHLHNICPVLGEYLPAIKLICDGAGASWTIMSAPARTLICRFIIPSSSFHINHLSGRQPLSLHWMPPPPFFSDKWQSAKHVCQWMHFKLNYGKCFYNIKSCLLRFTFCSVNNLKLISNMIFFTYIYIIYTLYIAWLGLPLWLTFF